MPEERRIYEEIGARSHADIERALREDDPEVLLRAVIGVSMHDADWHYAQHLCIRLSAHPHYNVRANAVLGFGHIARVHGRLDQAVVQPIIAAALRDEDHYIRGQAHCAKSDTEFFLKWSYEEGDAL